MSCMGHMPPKQKVIRNYSPYVKGRPFNKEYLKHLQRDVTIVVCQGCILKAEDAQHIARDVIDVTRETTLQWFVEQGVT